MFNTNISINIVEDSLSESLSEILNNEIDKRLTFKKNLQLNDGRMLGSGLLILPCNGVKRSISDTRDPKL